MTRLFIYAISPLLSFGNVPYDEDMAVKYIWIAQITAFPAKTIKSWTGGIAFHHAKEVSNVRIVQHGFPLDTLGVLADYDTPSDHDCLLAFRGSKDLENYLLDDGDAIMTAPYTSCPACKVHKGFFESWKSLKEQTLAALEAIGCHKRETRVTGHSLGAALAALAAFDLADKYPIKHVYTFGQPRTGNMQWVKLFEHKVPSFYRVVDYMDPVPRLPPLGFLSYEHAGPAVFYNATKLKSYHICADGENNTCGNQFSLRRCVFHGCDHCSYLGMNPCDLNSTTPQCSEPSLPGSEINLRESGTALRSILERVNQRANDLQII